MTKASLPDTSREAYSALRGGRFNTYGLDIFLRRGMLEWMLAIEKPAATYRTGTAGSAEANHSEIVAILTNMMEGGLYGV